MKRWWKRRTAARYDGIRFAVEGDALEPRAWSSVGEAGPLRWTARMERTAAGVAWRLRVEGTLTGAEERAGEAANAYAAADECRFALRDVIDEFNALHDGLR